MTDDMYLRIKQVTAVTGLSRATIYNMMSIGAFPMKTALGARAVGWLASEIQSWMAGRKLVEKHGVEAKPARPKEGDRQVLSHVKQQKHSKTLVRPRADAVTSKFSDWGEDDPPPTAAESQAISERLRVINAMKREEAKNRSPVKVRGNAPSDSDASRRSASTTAMRPRRSADVAPKAAIKRKV